MEEKDTKRAHLCVFGRLLAHYRQRDDDDGPISRNRLANHLLDGWCHESTIEKYERGEVRPHAGFIYAVARVMDLSYNEETALLMAVETDFMLNLWREYRDVVQEATTGDTTKSSRGR